MVMTHSHSLIPVQHGDTVQTVNARELHAFLEVGKDFSTWIKDRISKYGFQEGQDFTALITSAPQNGGAKVGRGGHNRIEFHISLDMAKELAMLERSDKGRQARQYFIECEKRLKEVTAVQAPTPVLPDFSNPAIAARAWADAIEAQGIAERKVLQDAPKVAFHDAVAESEGTHTLDEVAKLLGTGRKRLTDWLKVEGILRKDVSLPIQRYIDNDYFRVHEYSYHDRKGQLWSHAKALVTGRGLIAIQRLIGKSSNTFMLKIAERIQP